MNHADYRAVAILTLIAEMKSVSPHDHIYPDSKIVDFPIEVIEAITKALTGANPNYLS